MKIVVCIKQVPDTTEVKIDPVTNNLMREGIPSIMNPLDRAALAMALEIRKKHGGTVSILSMGPPQAREVLDEGLYRGADEATLLCDRRLGGADTLATAFTLAETVKKLGFDLILCGNEAVDGCTGQVGPCMGEQLGVPAFTYVTDFRVKGREITVERDTGKSLDIYCALLPAVVCIGRKDVSGAAVEKRADIPEVRVWNADFLDEQKIGANGSPTKVAAISVKERTKHYLHVDYNLSCEERISYIIRGGLEKKRPELVRGSAGQQAELLLKETMGRREEDNAEHK